MIQPKMPVAMKSILFVCRNGRRFYAQSSDLVHDNRLKALFSKMVLLHEEMIIHLNPYDPPGPDEPAMICLEAAMAGDVYRQMSADDASPVLDGRAAAMLAAAERHTANVLRLALHQALPDGVRELFLQRTKSFEAAAQQLDDLAVCTTRDPTVLSIAAAARPH